MNNIKKKIIELLEMYRDGKYSNILLNDFFRKNNLKKSERSFITEVFYGVIRNDIYLDYIIINRTKKIKKSWIRELLKISLYQILYMNSENKGVVWEATELVKKKYGYQLGNFCNGFLRSVLRDEKKEEKELRENKRLDILYSIPEWFYKIILKKYGEHSENYIKNIKKHSYISVRVNCLKYSCIEFEKMLEKHNIEILKKIDTVYYLNSGEILHSDEFKDGKIIVQDGSSYLSAKLLDAKKNERVLDMCSAPGSKTAVLAETMENKGEIVALDIYEHKLELIRENMKKLGIDIVKVEKKDATIYSSDKKFDKILVDAPCSGYGVLRKKPEVLYSKDRENIKNLSELQYKILLNASENLKNGGELVYSTCTIFEEENGKNIEKFLKENKGFTVVDIEIPDNIEYERDIFGGIQITYNERYLDSFYMIKLRKEN